MPRALRHDRSQILYPDLQPLALASRRDRYLSILSLRAARAAYHALAGRGGFADAAGEHLQWQLCALERGPGLRPAPMLRPTRVPGKTRAPRLNRNARHDPSGLLRPTAGETLVSERRRRCRSIVDLRCARRSYHMLADAGAFVDLVGGQVRWKLRELAARIGVRLVISGVPHEARGFAEVN